MDVTVGQDIAGYTVEAPLGRGGHASVWKVRRADAVFALKVLEVLTPGVRRRLHAEVEVMRRIDHPNVVRVHEVVQHGPAPAVVLQLVEGGTLRDRLWDSLHPDELERLVEGLLGGVAAAHGAGVVHRDLKPSNVLVDADGIPHVADFGLVKLLESEDADSTRSGATMGTPNYMSPEQIRDSSRVDVRSDVFSLGAILFEMVTGDKAFAGDTLLDVFTRIAAGDHAALPVLLPSRMRQAILGALETDPDRRIPDVPTLLTVWRGERGWLGTDADATLDSSADDGPGRPQVHFLPRDQWGTGAHLEGGDDLALRAWESGLPAFGAIGGPIWAPNIPVFDDLLALWFLDKPDVPDAIARALASYARLCRQGLAPGTAPPHLSPRTVLEELKREHDVREDATAGDALLAASAALFEHLVQRMKDGVDLFGESLFSGSHAFDGPIAVLRRDRDLYREDRARGRVLVGRLGRRSVDLLVLDEPVASGFAEWARADPDSPSQLGFGLLLVRWPDNVWVLTADPARRLRIDTLAAPLQAAEEDAGGTEPWYDGARHRGTLVASPLSGSKLSEDAVLAALAPALGLRPP